MASGQQQFQMQPVAPTIQHQQNLAIVAATSSVPWCKKLKERKQSKANAAKVKIREENKRLKEEKRM